MVMLLRIRHLSAFYGVVRAVFGLDLEVAAGGVTALLGANGAGKTTALRAISGLVRTAGAIDFDGRPIAGLPAEDIARRGIAHVPQGRGTFVAQTVEENLHIGALSRRDRAGIAADLERIYVYFPKLKERRKQQAGTLSGGEQQMLAIGRAMMLRPRLLLLDEPSFGLAPMIARDVFDILRMLNREQGVTMLVVEQNAALALALARDAYLMEAGRIVRSGPADRIRESEDVRRIYLGS
jgi:branched-chain amino acid transport system ATP-binding protein